MLTRHLDFETAYYQFFIADEDAAPSLTEGLWTPEASADRMAVVPGCISVKIGSYSLMEGVISYLDKPSTVTDFEEYDHVVEGSIEIQSGAVEVVPCTGEDAATYIEMKPGSYRVRVYSENLDTIEGDQGDDYYTVEMWAAPFADRAVLKRYS